MNLRSIRPTGLTLRSAGLAIGALGLWSLALGSCRSAGETNSDLPPPAPLVIEGSVLHRERIALPPHTVLEVRLEDSSRADSPARELAVERIELAGRQVPIEYRFEIARDEVDLPPHATLRAQLRVDGRLLFTTTQAKWIDTTQGEHYVQLLVERVRSDAPDRALTETRWRLTRLGEEAVEAVRDLTLVLRGSEYSGHGGLNGFSGRYRVEGASLTFQPGRITMRGGSPESMRLEADYVQALSTVDGWRIEGDHLWLEREGETVLEFRAVDLR